MVYFKEVDNNKCGYVKLSEEILVTTTFLWFSVKSIRLSLHRVNLAKRLYFGENSQQNLFKCYTLDGVGDFAQLPVVGVQMEG